MDTGSPCMIGDDANAAFGSSSSAEMSPKQKQTSRWEIIKEVKLAKHHVVMTRRLPPIQTPLGLDLSFKLYHWSVSSNFIPWDSIHWSRNWSNTYCYFDKNVKFFFAIFCKKFNSFRNFKKFFFKFFNFLYKMNYNLK